MKQLDFTVENFAELSKWLKSGKVAVLPTDTIPGFAADAGNPAALKKIARLKKRPTNKPFLFLVPDFVAAEKLCDFDDSTRRLANRFWPGGLTMLLPRKYGVLPEFFPHEPKFAIRIPDNKVLLKFLHNFGKPLVSTSINHAGEPAITKYSTIASHLQDEEILIAVQVVPDHALPSTIVAVENGKLEIVREGSISRNEIEKLQADFFH